MFTRRRIIILIIGFILIASAFTPLLVFAEEKDLSIQLSGMFGEAVSGLPEYIARVYNYAIALAVSLSIFMLMWGGFKWITAAGDRGKISSAQSTITDAVIGLVLALGAYVILNTINPAILSLKMPEIKPVARQTWGGTGCKEQLEDCPAGQTPINCQCVDVENLQVGGWCLVGDLSAGDAKCAKECQGCTCNPPPSVTCIELLAGAAADVSLAAIGGAMFIEPASFGKFVISAKKAGATAAKVFYKGGKLFFKIPGTKTMSGITFAVIGGAEICRETSEICEATTEEMAKSIGLSQLEDAVKKVIANLQGTLGSCYAVAEGSVEAGGFCGKDSNCQSNICVPFDPEVFKKKFEAKQKDWCDRFFDAKTKYLSKLGFAGKAYDWTTNVLKDVVATVTGSVGDLAKVVIGCGECGTILGNMGVCSSGEVGGSCWAEKDEEGKEVIFGCKKGLKCLVSGGSTAFLGRAMKACSDGREGSSCERNEDCQKGLSCFDFGHGIKKCESANRGWQRYPCVDNGGCVEDNFPPKSTEVKNIRGEIALVHCIKVSGAGSAGLPDYTAKKFMDHNQGKTGRCGRGGQEYGDPCFKVGYTSIPGGSPPPGECRRGLECALRMESGMVRRYTIEDQKEGWWGLCCQKKGGNYICGSPSAK